MKYFAQDIATFLCVCGLMKNKSPCQTTESKNCCIISSKIFLAWLKFTKWQFMHVGSFWLFSLAQLLPWHSNWILFFHSANWTLRELWTILFHFFHRVIRTNLESPFARLTDKDFPSAMSIFHFLFKQLRKLCYIYF